MAKLINADKLYDILEDYYKRNREVAHGVMRKALEEICYAPPIDAVPVRHGRWVKEPDRNHWHCSECQSVWGLSHYAMNFCPECGADLREENSTIRKEPINDDKQM